MSPIADFLDKVIRIYNGGHATEHSYRPALETLFNSLSDDVTAINEPKRVACGAPDFILQRGEIAIGHAEAKDIPVGLRGMKDTNKNQQERYLKALPNLIYTNNLDWDFYRNGELVASVTIADFILGIQAKTDQFATLENLLRDFVAQRPQSITSPKVLAEIMAGKASLIKDVLHNALKADMNEETELFGQYAAFKEQLIHDIDISDFADLYAETIAYGMFAARLHDTTPDTFTRQEAQALLPKTNPFLRSLFSYVSATDLDERIVWVIDDLATVFRAANVAKIMEGFGKLTGQNDPFLHFYENFLAAYNPNKRKARGVWYTPEAVVNFIVRAVDDVLISEFDLPLGLADTSKITIKWDTGQTQLKKGGKKNEKTESSIIQKEAHRVQILDPATGTGTFLAEVLKHVAPKIKGVAPGKWSGYLETDLIPRLHGFELLMASYAMCHMKLDMILTELGYKPTSKPPRLSVYLTNSLEEGEREVQDLFMAQWLTREAREANDIKRQTPIMCVIGNPPYSGESKNKSGWIADLMEAYKKEPGGKVKLKEKNSKWLNDDYMKFIRLSEHFIERTGEGVLGVITNHGYLSNPTFRGMRWHLLQTFDKLYVLDLHGNTKRKEVTPDGSSDKNVFDIQQGVSILIGVRKRTHTGERQKTTAQISACKVFHADLWGDRQKKYNILREASIATYAWNELQLSGPQYDFVPRDHSQKSIYEQGFLISDFMPIYGNGIVTKRDNLNIHHAREDVTRVAEDIVSLDEKTFRYKYELPDDVRDWQYEWAKKDVMDHSTRIPIQKIGYRLFDNRFIFYSGRSRGLVGWPVYKVMRHYLNGQNIGFLTSKAHRDKKFAHIFITDKPTEAIHYSATTGSNAMNFPLYLYPEDEVYSNTRVVNFDLELFAKMKTMAKNESHGEPNEVDVFDYIYGVLHSLRYREAYAEFLATDCPRIPWPQSPRQFWHVAAKGSELRKLHLMEPKSIGSAHYTFTGAGDDVVDKPKLEDGKIWINDSQYFDNVPVDVWEFWIGGYQPARKWLKDRAGRMLSFEDIQHYQRILKVLERTREIMEDIEA